MKKINGSPCDTCKTDSYHQCLACKDYDKWQDRTLFDDTKTDELTDSYTKETGIEAYNDMGENSPYSKQFTEWLIAKLNILEDKAN